MISEIYDFLNRLILLRDSPRKNKVKLLGKMRYQSSKCIRFFNSR